MPVSEIRYTPSAHDERVLAAIRANVSAALARFGRESVPEGGLVLDIAPQDHEGLRPYVGAGVRVETLDIDPESGCTWIADLCRPVPGVEDGRFDAIVCTELLEHVTQPFDAVREIRRMLRPGGVLLASSPFGFRIHGPLPDCWRISEHGWRALLADFTIESLDELTDPDRPLMPWHYTVVARRT